MHQNPELSGYEYKTNLYVINCLKKYDAKIINIDLSVLCFFDKKRKNTIALRSELDALPIKENSSHVIKSSNENMHACGHDIHTASLLKLAEYISENDFNYNICLIFQSKEESGAGSLRIINTDVFSNLNIKYVIGMHVWPNLDYNKVYSNEKLMFGSYELDIEIKGENNHISSYNPLTDATYCSFLLYKKLYKITDNYISHLGEIKSGNLRNISSDKSTMKYSIRFADDNFIKEKILKTKVKTNCDISYNFLSYYPVLNNDLELLNLINYEQVPTLKSSEDFGYYSKKAKVLYLLFGLGKGYNLHTSNFNTNKEIRELYYFKLLEILNKINKMPL